MRSRATTIAVIGAALALLVAGCADRGDEGRVADESDATEAGAGDDDPIAIGVLTSLTGPFTPWGLQARAGMQLAADEINAAGGVDGRGVELIEADDRNSVDEAVTAFERMVESDEVLAVGGVISSSVGVAVAEVAEELRTPLLVVKAGSPDVLTSASRHTFRTCLPAAPMVADPLLRYARDAGVTRIGGIVADYAWGRGVQEALETTFAGSGIELQLEAAPVDAADFTPYLRRLADADPDLVVATGHPPGAGSIAVQAADLGFDVPVTGPWAALATVVEAIGPVAFDDYADFACVDWSSPGYHELAARFAETSELSFMEADAVAGYGIVQAVAEAVENGAEDPAAVAAYLHANDFEVPGYSHVLSWTAWGELASSQPTLSVIRAQAPPDGVNPGAEWYPEVLSTSDPLEPHRP